MGIGFLQLSPKIKTSISNEIKKRSRQENKKAEISIVSPEFAGICPEFELSYITEGIFSNAENLFLGTDQKQIAMECLAISIFQLA